MTHRLLVPILDRRIFYTASVSLFLSVSVCIRRSYSSARVPLAPLDALTLES